SSPKWVTCSSPKWGYRLSACEPKFLPEDENRLKKEEDRRRGEDYGGSGSDIEIKAQKHSGCAAERPDDRRDNQQRAKTFRQITRDGRGDHHRGGDQRYAHGLGRGENCCG